MVMVKCRLCSNLDGIFCRAKKSGGKNPSVKPNNNRKCSKFKPDPIKFAEEVDREYKKQQIPIKVPTWRYYATKKERDEDSSGNGPMFVRRPSRVL